MFQKIARRPVLLSLMALLCKVRPYLLHGSCILSGQSCIPLRACLPQLGLVGNPPLLHCCCQHGHLRKRLAGHQPCTRGHLLQRVQEGQHMLGLLTAGEDTQALWNGRVSNVK